ncbi:MAG TPA: PQQ-binding-like beta-propeller repeat protein [Chthoniobacteraceae bacterium]|jgi:outer membrane protein assembly factor BamB
MFLRPLLQTSFFLISATLLHAADQPQWGQAWTRNLVSEEKGLPVDWDLETGRNVKWSVPLGTQTFATPIVAGGRVYIGTNNEVPRDPTHLGDRGVMLCLDEADGRLLWQLLVPKRDEDQYYDWPKTGMSSPITVEGERAYLVNNRGAVVCLDVRGLQNGNDGPFQDEAAQLTPRAVASAFTGGATPPDGGATAGPRPPEPLSATDADIIWHYDLPSGAGTWPHDGAHTSILIHGDYLYLNTGTGVDNTHRVIRTPDAPSLVVIEKSTGRLVAKDDEHIAPNIFHASWSSPALAEVGGRTLIFFVGGDGIVRAFAPVTKSPPAGEVAKLNKIWQFDPDPTAPKEQVHRFTGNKQQGPSNVYGMPVFAGNRLFVAGGGDLWWGKNEAWLKCIDATKTGEVTGTAQRWSYPLDRHTMSTPAVHGGLVFATDTARKLHCVDAETGQPLWTHEAKGDFWASPLVADGKVFVGSKKGDFSILAAAREKQLLGTMDFKKTINATATAANGVLYVATMTHLHALKSAAPAAAPEQR